MDTNSVRFFKEQPLEKLSSQARLILAAWKLTNAENIGKVIRLAHNVGAIEVLFIKGKEEHRLSRIKKTAGFSFEQMSWKFLSEEEFIYDYLSRFLLTVLETCDGATNIFTTPLSAGTILLAGSESYGIPGHIIKKSSARVFIPIQGDSKSLNIANALSVGAFEWLRQQLY